MGTTLENLTQNEKDITFALLIFRLSYNYKWGEEYSDRLEKIWDKMKKSVNYEFMNNTLKSDIDKWISELEEKYD